MYKEGAERQKLLDAVTKMNLRNLGRELSKSQGQVAHWRQLYENSVKKAPSPAQKTFKDTSELLRARKLLLQSRFATPPIGLQRHGLHYGK